MKLISNLVDTRLLKIFAKFTRLSIIRLVILKKYSAIEISRKYLAKCYSAIVILKSTRLNITRLLGLSKKFLDRGYPAEIAE